MPIVNQIQGIPIFDSLAAQGALTSNGTAKVFPTQVAGVVRVRANKGNTNPVYIGRNSGTVIYGGADNTSVGYQLAPGDSEYFFVKNLQSLYLISQTSGDGVTYIVYQI
jgi:hypothetical protein